MPLLNYTTSVPVDRTVGEIQIALAAHGASAIGVRYVDRQPSGLSFMLAGPQGEQSYVLPVNADAVHKILTGPRYTALRKSRRQGPISVEQSARVAWRIIKDWVEAQLAVIETNMVTFDQVMLPYMIVGPNSRTVYDEYRARELPQ